MVHLIATSILFKLIVEFLYSLFILSLFSAHLFMVENIFFIQ